MLATGHRHLRPSRMFVNALKPAMLYGRNMDLYPKYKFKNKKTVNKAKEKEIIRERRRLKIMNPFDPENSGVQFSDFFTPARTRLVQLLSS